MPSYLHLRYGGKIKQFIWPMEPDNALQAIGHAFNIKPDTIVGFKDKKGSIHSVDELLEDPEEAQKQSFMVVVEIEDKKGQVSARTLNAKNVQIQNQNVNQNAGLMLISNFAEFERIFLKNNRQGLFVIFVLNQRQQLDEIASKASSFTNLFSQKFDFFTYFFNEHSDDFSVFSRNFPLALVYYGDKRLVEVPFDANQKNLANLLERINPSNSEAVGEQTSQAVRPSTTENSASNTTLKLLESLYRQNEITGTEYYYTKTSVLENQADVTAILSRFTKSSDVNQLITEIKELASREPRLSLQGAPKQVKPQPPVMRQNFVRPMTSEGRPKSQKPQAQAQARQQLSLVQEKLIETTEDLENKNLLDDQAASRIKALILEENAEVIRIMDSYDADVDDEQELSYQLNRFLENKQGRNQERKGEGYERPPSQGGASYFLESKSKRGGREHLYDSAISEEYRPVRQPEQIPDLTGALKNNSTIKNLPADQYGMIIWMAKNKGELIGEVINDHGGIDAIDRALSNLILLGDKELNSRLREQMNDRQRAYITEHKNIRNSTTYSAFQCFKYDQDLDGLVRSLEDAVKSVPLGESRSTPSRAQGAAVHAAAESSGGNSSGGSRKGKDYIFPQNFSDLAVIREEDKVSSTKHATYNDGTRLGFDSAMSSQGDITQSLKPAAISSGNLDGMRTSGSKYTALLNRDQRADSFKGMFQLKLVSSDNPAAAQAKEQITKAEPPPTRQEFFENDTKNSLDAHVNVIIPAKSEINQFTQTFIDKFYESQEDYTEGLEKFKKILLNFAWISGDDVAKIEYLYENFYYELFEVIYNYEMNRNLNELERRLREDILTVDLDNISHASTSPRERKRMTTYHSFKALLQNLRNENYISEKQYKTYLYLYTEEDVTVLAAYEVFQFTHDISDFIDTLLLIEKVQFFKNESKYFEDISNFSDTVEYQLKIIFSLKRYLTSETRATLEKIIRSGDNTIFQIYQDYKKIRDNKNKNNLIHKLVNFAEENMEVVKNYEKSLVQNKAQNEQKNVRRRELVENFEAGRLLPEVKYFDLLYDSIDKDEELIHSIFEIYDFTKDKIDFIENITLVYKYLYRRNALDVLDANKEKYGMTDDDIDQIEIMYKKKEGAILGPTELFYATSDEQDFVETVSLLFQARRAMRRPI